MTALRSSVWFLLLLWLATGCARVKVAHRSAGFDVADLEAGGLGIAAVTAMGGGEYFLADNTSRAFVRAMAERYPAVRVVPLQELRTRFPSDAYTNLLQDFSELGTVRDTDFELLKAARPAVRYVLLVNFDRDRANLMEHRSSQEHTKQVWNEKTKKYETESDYTEYSTSRTASRYVSATFIICDLESREPVWIVKGGSGDSDSTSSSSSSSTPPPPRWPSPPSSTGPIDKITQRIVRKLPAK